jgi:hypothetical protein
MPCENSQRGARQLAGGLGDVPFSWHAQLSTNSKLNFIATSKNLNFPWPNGVAVTLLRGKLLVPHNRTKIRIAAEREEDALLETARTNAQKSKS